MRRLLPFLALVVLLGVFAEPSLAQDRTSRVAFEALTPAVQARVVTGDPLLRFRTQAVPGGRVDVDEGVLRAAYRIGRRVPLAATPEATARAYLNAEAPRFGWPDADDLDLKTVVRGRYSTHLTFQQTFFGLPVYNRLIKVNLNPAGQPTMVLSGYAPHLARLSTFNTSPSLSAAAAQARVQAAVSAGGARTSTPELVVYPAQTPRLAWRMLAWPDGLPAEWEVLLDARTGEIIHLLDQSTHAHMEEPESRRTGEPGTKAAPEAAMIAPKKSAMIYGEPLRSSGNPQSAIVDGTGLVFDPDPLTTAGVEHGGEYVDANDTDVQALNDERVEVTLLDITLSADGFHRLEGPFVTIDGASQIGGTGWTPPAEADPAGFQYGRANDFFEAVMAYYHVDKSQRYVQSLDVGRDIQAVPVRVNPHGLGTQDQSRYFPGLNGIAFGDGGIDDAEDADVIWHEYGHALLQGSAPGLLNNNEGRALHEGWSDYWAVSYSRGLIEAGKVPERDWRKIFTWDGNESWLGRVLNSQGHYPEDARCDDGPCDIYNDGLIWATTLMEIYEDIGKEVTDRLNLASHGYLSAPVSFVDAAEALIQADLDLYDGEHLSSIIDRLGTRGFIDPSAFGPALAHEPFTIIEEAGSTVTFTVDALAVGSPVTRVLLFYSINGASFELLELDAQGDNRYTGALALPPGTTEVAYYIEAIDEQGLRTRLPSGAPANTFAFDVGADTEAPQIIHEPITQVTLQAWPARVVARVADNQGVDSVWVTYLVNRPDGTPLTEGTFSLTREAEEYAGVFPVSSGALREGSKVFYRLHALDVARSPNEALLPLEGTPAFEIDIVVEGVLATFDFESDQPLAATGAWVRGIPGYGVQVAHSGQNVWATNLDGPYPSAEQSATLDLPSFNLNNNASAYLVFWHWYDFEHSGISEPGPSASGTLWDGGNVKVSINDGASWAVVDPLGGYSGTLEQGTGNPLQGQPAFGGYSFGWRRVIVPLPTADDVRIRFEMGTDGSNELASLFYAGWYLDDVRVITDLPQDATPPTIAKTPETVVQADAGRVPPALVVEASDDVGVEAVLAEYEIIPASGSPQQGTLRLAMTASDLTTFRGVIPTQAPLGVGDQVVYRLRVRDFDGNTVVFPAVGQTPLRIEYRLTERVSALQGVRASGLWRPLGQGFTANPTDGLLETVSSLVLEPFDLPANTDVITLALSHTYRFGTEIGGNLKISLDDGATWTVLEPEGGYGAVYQPEAGHPMQGERVFAGQTSNQAETTFDLVAFAGRQVRLRLDFATPRALEASEFWSIAEASLALSTLNPTFEIPRTLALHANFPDPFLESTTISFTLPEAMPVRLELYNILGQRIAVLVDGQQEAGTHTLTMSRGGLAGGVYLLRMMAAGRQEVERMVITP